MFHFHGAGKTTLLRDIVRNISNGNEFLDGLTVGLLDERGELSAMYKGEAQNDVGCRTDVLSNIPKAMGMKMLIRSMAPQVLVADEIGNNDDIIAIKEAMCSRNKGNIYSTWSNIKRSIFKRTLKTTFKLIHIWKNNILKTQRQKRGNRRDFHIRKRKFWIYIKEV